MKPLLRTLNSYDWRSPLYMCVTTRIDNTAYRDSMFILTLVRDGLKERIKHVS